MLLLNSNSMKPGQMFCHDIFSEPSTMALTAELRRLRQEDHASQDCRAAESSVMRSVSVSEGEAVERRAEPRLQWSETVRGKIVSLCFAESKRAESVLASLRETPTILPSTQKPFHTLSCWKALVVSLPELPCMHSSRPVAITLTGQCQLLR